MSQPGISLVVLDGKPLAGVSGVKRGLACFVGQVRCLFDISRKPISDSRKYRLLNI